MPHRRKWRRGGRIVGRHWHPPNRMRGGKFLINPIIPSNYRIATKSNWWLTNQSGNGRRTYGHKYFGIPASCAVIELSTSNWLSTIDESFKCKWPYLIKQVFLHFRFSCAVPGPPEMKEIAFCYSEQNHTGLGGLVAIADIDPNTVPRANSRRIGSPD